MIHAGVEDVHPFEMRGFACGGEELPGVIGEDVARKKCRLDARAIRVRKTPLGFGRKHNQLERKRFVRGKGGQVRAMLEVAAMRNE